MATKAEMDSVWRTLKAPLYVALILGVAGFIFGNREELHAQDKRVVAIETILPKLVIVEDRFSQILVEMAARRGDTLVIRTEIRALDMRIGELCARMEELERRGHKEND